MASRAGPRAAGSTSGSSAERASRSSGACRTKESAGASFGREQRDDAELLGDRVNLFERFHGTEHQSHDEYHSGQTDDPVSNPEHECD